MLVPRSTVILLSYITRLLPSSLLSKMDELSLLLNTHPLEVVAITELWLANEIIDELVLIDGYNTFCKDIVHSRGGGVCAFVSADIPCKRRQDRGEHVLDLIVTKLDEIYNEPTVTAPLGTSDHNVIKWTPSASELYGKNTSKLPHSLLVMPLVDGATVTPGLQTLRIMGHALKWHLLLRKISP